MKSLAASLIEHLRLPAFESPEAEKAFWEWDDTSKLPFRKFSLFSAVVAFMAISLLDTLAGESMAQLLAIQAIAASMLLVVLYLFCRDCTPSRRDTLILLFGLVAAGAIVVMTLVAPRPSADFYPFLLSAEMAFAGALAIPRFTTLAWFCIATNIVYWPSTYFSATSTLALLFNLFVMTVTSLAVVIGAYNREKLERDQMRYQTRLAEARQEAEFSRDKALQANQAKSHLLANVSHELRTPMNAILGFSEIMQTEMFGSIEQPQYREYLGDIHSSGLLLQSSINDLLDVSRLDVNKMSWDESWIYLQGVIERAIQTCKRDAETAGISVTYSMESDTTVMLCDPERMIQILINLITNAVKFSDAGSTIQIHAKAQQACYVLNVSDDGCGIPEDEIEHICEPFGQVGANCYNAKKGGLGLGLAIVRGLVTRFGGVLDINSTVGVGTSVSLLIPMERIETQERTRVAAIHPNRWALAASA